MNGGSPGSGPVGAACLLPVPAQIDDFCRNVIRNAIHLVAIVPESARTNGQWFGDDVESAVNWAAERNRAGANIYWTINVIREGQNRKPRKIDIIAVRFAQSDIDPPKDGSEWSLQKELVKILEFQPSLVIASGNGLQALFRLEAPIGDSAAIEAINRTIIARTGGDVACSNVDRLFRVPGTINYPNARKRAYGRAPALATTIFPETRAPWTLAELSGRFPPISRATSHDAARAPEIGGLATADHLCPPPTGRLRDLIENPVENDRSNDVMACAIEMAELSYPEEVVMGILMNPANAVHAHVADQKNPLRAAQRAVARARSSSPAARFAKPAVVPPATMPPINHPAISPAPVLPPEGPRPLRRLMPPPLPFPLRALGSVLEGAAMAIIDRVQCPDAMAAQSVLGVASLAVQGHANVIMPPNGRPTPTSLFLVTVAGTGERKSAADGEALWPVAKYEGKLRQTYRASLRVYETAHAAYQSARTRALAKAGSDPAAGRAALTALGPEPFPPLVPMVLVPEPTLEGLHKLYAVGNPSLGLFSDEGGQFVGGNGMNTDNRLKTSAGLSDLWDGKPIRRVRAVDGASVMPGRRLASHLMMQPDVAAGLLSDPVLKDQGLLSRLLVAAPGSLAGTRFQRSAHPASESALSCYQARVLSILETPYRLADGTQNELVPRSLALTDEARALWSEYADVVECRLAGGGDLEPVRGLANKLPEHAVRLAAVLALIDDLKVSTVSGQSMQRGIDLANFYASEALRLFDASAVSAPIRKAESLLGWLHRVWDQPQIGLRQIYQFGPNAIREAAKAREAVNVLVNHGWLMPLAGGSMINGERCTEAWTIDRQL